jgi:hypothetical protein
VSLACVSANRVTRPSSVAASGTSASSACTSVPNRAPGGWPSFEAGFHGHLDADSC